MCAICGIVNFDHSEPVDGAIVEKMMQTLVHRGADDRGLLFQFWRSDFIDNSAHIDNSGRRAT
jgi:asparagine synthetase B (glutamine-hydrolysing)